MPLAVKTTPANVRDDQQALDLIAAVPALPDASGTWHRRPGCVLGDSAYGVNYVILSVMLLGIVPLLAKYQHRPHGSALGRLRYVVERTFSWFGHRRRIKLCYEKRWQHFQGFHDLAAALICFKRLQKILHDF